MDLTPGDDSRSRREHTRDRDDTRALETLVDLAAALVGAFDLSDLLHVVAQRCAELVQASDVGILLLSLDGDLRVAASSSERMHTLELFEIQAAEGPCYEVATTGQAVINGSVSPDSRWPTFAARARAAGYLAVHALPMRHNGSLIGVVNVFDESPATLDEDTARIAQALADIASFAILQHRAVQEATDLAGQLQTALNSRVVIEQAKGVLADRLSLSMPESFALLRDYSRNANARIDDVARQVVARELDIDQVRSGARATNTRTSPRVGRGR